MVERSPEKAGVGGSTPSLATIIPKNLVESRLALPVRYFSARSGSVPGYDDREGLNLEVPLAQSAFSPLLSAAWLKIAVGICPCRSHAILADTVGINTAESISE